MSQFGDLVRKLRKEKGLTLEEVARKIGSHKGYVSGIENGKVNPPSVKFIRKFARLFKYNDREMVRMAYVDKAPASIRDEIRALVLSGRSAGGDSASVIEVPLLNTTESGYATSVRDDGALEPVVDATLTVPKSRTLPVAAATVCDNSMERDESMSFSRGDVIFLSPMPKIQNAAVVYAVFRTNGRSAALLRQVMLEQKENIVLQPFNKDYPLEFLTREDLAAVYAVVGKMEMFVPAPRAVPV